MLIGCDIQVRKKDPLRDNGILASAWLQFGQMVDLTLGDYWSLTFGAQVVKDT